MEHRDWDLLMLLSIVVSVGMGISSLWMVHPIF